MIHSVEKHRFERAIQHFLLRRYDFHMYQRVSGIDVSPVNHFQTIFPLFCEQVGHKMLIKTLGVTSQHEYVFSHIMGVSPEVALDLLMPCRQTKIHVDLMDLSSEATAAQFGLLLENFIDLVGEGEIKDHQFA